MERLFTAIFSGLVLVPAAFWAGMAVYLSLYPAHGNSDNQIASGFMGVLVGILTAAAAFVAALFLTPFLPLRYVQIADVVILIASIAVWRFVTAETPQLIYPEGHHGVLTVEFRATKSMLRGASIRDAISFRFDGDGDQAIYEDLVRHEGEFSILPIQVFPQRTRGKDWAMLVFAGEHPQSSVSFPLALPPQPKADTEWSPWISPSPNEGQIAPTGLQLRWRFHLARYGAPDPKSLSYRH